MKREIQTQNTDTGNNLLVTLEKDIDLIQGHTESIKNIAFFLVPTFKFTEIQTFISEGLYAHVEGRVTDFNFGEWIYLELLDILYDDDKSTTKDIFRLARLQHALDGSLRLIEKRNVDGEEKEKATFEKLTEKYSLVLSNFIMLLNTKLNDNDKSYYVDRTIPENVPFLLFDFTDVHDNPNCTSHVHQLTF